MKSILFVTLALSASFALNASAQQIAAPSPSSGFAARGGLSGKTYPWGDEFRPGGKWMANTWGRENSQ
jgi:hypothetical protein